MLLKIAFAFVLFIIEVWCTNKITNEPMQVRRKIDPTVGSDFTSYVMYKRYFY